MYHFSLQSSPFTEKPNDEFVKWLKKFKLDPDDYEITEKNFAGKFQRNGVDVRISMHNHGVPFQGETTVVWGESKEYKDGPVANAQHNICSVNKDDYKRKDEWEPRDLAKDESYGDIFEDYDYDYQQYEDEFYDDIKSIEEYYFQKGIKEGYHIAMKKFKGNDHNRLLRNS